MNAPCPTPLERFLDGFDSPACEVHLQVKRDDLYPVCGGGNKGRKLRRFLQGIADRQQNAVVTNGGLQSNHARAVALAAAKRGWRCRLVLHGDPERLRAPTGNLLLMMLAGAEITLVKPEDMAEALDAAMDGFHLSGLCPCQIPGGGHSIEGSAAYADAIDELADQAGDWRPDFIVLASGTGTTQAGILAGVERRGWKTRVIGISVGRRNPRGTDVTRQAYDELRSRLRLAGAPLPVEFRDEWIGDGYEQPCCEVFDTIRRVARTSGLILDPTYTGKAFRGLESLVRSGEITAGSRVIFWHTGGLLNLMAFSCFPTTGDQS
ncbi:MAG: pyridoxal-phosphate dependent enzyme [Thermoguttaceae bacterium]|jgi:1-aminocyclopropane-1-carboxylate deaminase/D-cysteine desulfhydrase-like pyridoxal-dependent ACC family enzyme|nr:pyridoxal-phosphate dependent enzyme [Thermoguttaceae bacterium]